MCISVEAMALCIYAKKWEIWDTYFWLALKYPNLRTPPLFLGPDKIDIGHRVHPISRAVGKFRMHARGSLIRLFLREQRFLPA